MYECIFVCDMFTRLIAGPRDKADCEPPDPENVNWTQDFCKNSMHSWPSSFLSSTYMLMILLELLNNLERKRSFLLVLVSSS